MKDKIKYDTYGRVIVEDEKLLEQISGASIEVPDLDNNGACGDNGGCGNAACANASC